MADAVAIVITDPDMDTSPDRDQIEFAVTAAGRVSRPVPQRKTSSATDGSGNPLSRMFIALETEPHSGVFTGSVLDEHVVKEHPAPFDHGVFTHGDIPVSPTVDAWPIGRQSAL